MKTRITFVLSCYAFVHAGLIAIAKQSLEHQKRSPSSPLPHTKKPNTWLGFLGLTELLLL
jgi:hypothetical protein